MKKVIANLGLKNNLEQNIIKKIDKTITLLKSGKIIKAELKIKQAIKQVKFKENKKKKIDQDDADLLITMLDNLLNNLN